MIETTIDRENNLIIATARDTLVEMDFNNFSDCINDYINSTDRAPSIVLNAEELPHWKNSAALFAHIKLVRNHQKILPKVALVSDNSALSLMPLLVDLFVKAKVRHFHQCDFDKAIAWASKVDDDRSAIKMINGLPADVVAYEVVGTLTSRDYQEILTPLVDDKLKVHDKIKILVVLGEAFDGATASAMWDDTRLGLSHITAFSKLAVVSDIGWVRQGAKIFGPLIPAQLHVFENNRIDDAKEWIKS
ncbi:STAS/SEC14 domain-containing protein [Hoeflea sp. TYP-13]|uniref:STAS/SEC14 domain-containing protein n=1 Tax=Hoeflea sp. TYP-13 TaxID=3230023 RepID=UPI0034C60BE0